MKKLKPVPKGKKHKGLRKLPKQVRNKMGYMKKGGRVKYWREKVCTQTFTLKENVVAKCERKVQRVRPLQLTFEEPPKLREKDND